MSVDIVWLRDDFRLDDQPAIAAVTDRPALTVYVHDDSPRNGRPPGGAAKWRLAQSLAAMQKRLAERGARLDVVRGAADRTILALAEAADAARVLWTRRYEGAAMALDAGVKAALRERGVEGLSFNARLMREPWEVARADGAPAGAFSAFWRRHRALGALAAAPARARRLTRGVVAGACSPARPDRGAAADPDRAPTGRPSSRSARPRARTAASRRWRASSIDALPSYADGRDMLALDSTSRLSAHLRFGEISAAPGAPLRRRAPRRRDPRLAQPAEKYLAELGWRDFAAALLYAHPDMAERPLRREFERFPWRDDRAGFRAWTRGETGYPVVDAGMRQLWRTGYMHNRVRMIAASFLGQAPSDRLAARRGMVLGHALRRRPRQQSAELAVGRRMRRRRRALFSHLQPRPAGREIRSRGILCPPLGSRAREARGAAYPCAVDGAGRRPSPAPASPSAGPIRGRSSTMPPPAPGRSPPSRKSGAGPGPEIGRREARRIAKTDIRFAFCNFPVLGRHNRYRGVNLARTGLSLSCWRRGGTGVALFPPACSLRGSSISGRPECGVGRRNKDERSTRRFRPGLRKIRPSSSLSTDRRNRLPSRARRQTLRPPQRGLFRLGTGQEFSCYFHARLVY